MSRGSIRRLLLPPCLRLRPWPARLLSLPPHSRRRRLLLRLLKRRRPPHRQTRATSRLHHRLPLHQRRNQPPPTHPSSSRVPRIHRSGSSYRESLAGLRRTHSGPGIPNRVESPSPLGERTFTLTGGTLCP